MTKSTFFAIQFPLFFSENLVKGLKFRNMFKTVLGLRKSGTGLIKHATLRDNQGENT